MKTLLDVQRQLTGGEFEFSRHAFRRGVERNISEQEICEAGRNAEVIEDYPEDKYSPSLARCCLGSRPVDGRCTFRYPLVTRRW
jgi:hypothetical protein